MADMCDSATCLRAAYRPTVIAGLALVLLGSADVASAEESDALARFFPAAAVEEARTYRRDFANAGTAGKVAGLFHRALALEQLLLAPIRERYQYGDWPLLLEFREAELELPGLAPACAAECTEPSFRLLLPVFMDAAAKTRDAADDVYFGLVSDFFHYIDLFDGDLNGWPVLFEQTWDYGGHSLLGQGGHLAMLLRIDAIKSRFRLFPGDLEMLRSRVFEDLLTISSCSGLPAAAVMKEIGEILALVELSQTETEQLTARRAAFGDPAAHHIQVDCREQACTCNSG